MNRRGGAARKWFGLCAVLGVLLASRPVGAGGPMVYADDGTIVKWANGASNIRVRLDRGPLGQLTNAQADALVADIMSVWNSVAESTVDIRIASQELDQDIDETNYDTVLGAFIDGITPVVYDTDGQITDAMLGSGARNQVLGFAGPLFPADYNPPNILEGFVVLNGRMLDGVDQGASNPEFGQNEYKSVIVHEFGHMLGLDHSQINALDGSNDDQPTMFPIFYGGTAMGTLAPDDIGWISFLYPSMQYDSSFGEISGEVLEHVGMDYEGYQGINVIARLVGGGRIDAGSCVSGYIYREGVGPNELKGVYVIPGAQPGSYTVEVEEVLDLFTGGSSVGPLDPPADFPGIAGHEYYDGPTESPYDNPADKTPVSVAAGSETSDIDIILNTETGPSNRADRWYLFR